LPSRGITSRAGLVEESAAEPHEVRLTDGVLSDAPSGRGAIRSDQILAWPSHLDDDLAESSGVGPMNRLHARMVTLEERAVGGQFRSDGLIVSFPADQFVVKRTIHGSMQCRSFWWDIGDQSRLGLIGK
jgi:hypothetical protein